MQGHLYEHVDYAPHRDVLEVSRIAGVFFVPAFGGLLAPHWQDDARGIILGLTSYSTKAHIVRAMLEAIAWQV